MTHLSTEDKNCFKENGCLIVRGVLSPEQIQAAQDALWENIEADRNDPATWVEASQRSPTPATHPAIRATVHESPIFAMMEEMVGKDQLNPSSAGPALRFPSKGQTWSPPERGHLDGYYTPTNGVPEGTVGYMTINVTIYVEDIDSKGGCFTYWPGSHHVAHEYFKTHSLLSVQGGVSSDIYPAGEFPEGREFVGQAGAISATAFCPTDEDALLSLSKSDGAVMWDLRTRSIKRRLQFAGRPVCFSWCGSGRRVCFGLSRGVRKFL